MLVSRSIIREILIYCFLIYFSKFSFFHHAYLNSMRQKYVKMSHLYTLCLEKLSCKKKKRFDHALKKKNEFENIRKNGNHIQFTISNVKDSSDIIIKEDGLHVERKHCVLFVKAQYQLITVTFFDNNFFLLFLFRQSWNSVYICHH